MLLALAATACAPAEAPSAPDPLAGPCNAAPLAPMIGRAWSESLRAEVLRISGARALRAIGPGDIVSMDFRSDRLNVHHDGDRRIERFQCG
jgi:hypothetical protein